VLPAVTKGLTRSATTTTAAAATANLANLFMGGNLRTGHPLASPSPTPLVSPMPAPPLPSGSMSAGTYSVTDATLTLVPYTVTVPAGWTGGDGALRGEMSSPRNTATASA
jgi:hypothetical protein